MNSELLRDELQKPETTGLSHKEKLAALHSIEAKRGLLCRQIFDERK